MGGVVYCLLMMFLGGPWFLAWALAVIVLIVGISHLRTTRNELSVGAKNPKP